MNQWPTYADYGAGTAYVISSDMVDKIHEMSQTLKSSLKIDDVSMCLCAKTMSIAPLYHVFFSDEGNAFYHPCIYKI
jgi:uncharacterized membrane protein